MTGTLYFDGHKVDRRSQRLILYLHENGESTTGDMREYVGVSQNQQIIYRVKEHLYPAGLVDYDREESRFNREAGVLRYRLTDTARNALENGALEKLQQTKTVEELFQTVDEAVEEAESAKSSVQTYRSTVSELRSDVESVESDVDAEVQQLRDEMPTADTAREEARRAVELELAELRDEIEDVEDNVDILCDRLDDDERDLRVYEDALSDLVETVDDLGSNLERQYAELLERHESLDERVTEIESDLEEDESGTWLSR